MKRIALLILIFMFASLVLCSCDALNDVPFIGSLVGGDTDTENTVPDADDPSDDTDLPNGENTTDENPDDEKAPDDDKVPNDDKLPGTDDNTQQEPETKTYKVTFINAEGPDSGESYAQLCKEGEHVIEPTLAAMEEYEFCGWYADSDLAVLWNFEEDVVRSDMNLYAKWKEIKKEILPTTVFLVGDSTVCSFSDSYYYPRYGYGTQLASYLTDKATVNNLALSGRSSKSFISEDNYSYLEANISEGDYLIIAFGHNDEKSDDPLRFTDASKPYTDPSSFGFYLYEYYVKLAIEKGAHPILCTPIVRASTKDDYSGSEGHITANGNYRQAVIDLGSALGIPVVDLTAITAQRYTELGFDSAAKYHAVIGGLHSEDGTGIVPNMSTIDKTHLNIYGAKYVAYTLANELRRIDGISDYVSAEITEPTESDLIANPDYTVPDYTAPDLENYDAIDRFATISDGWYGTAFGNTGGDPTSDSNGFIAKETSEGIFSVGSSKNNKGKFENASDGFAFVFTQVEANKNFVLSATAKITSCAGVKQAGFGLMLRDDCIVGQNSNGTISTNYLTAGICAHSTSQMGVLFYRENATLNKGTLLSGTYAEADEAELRIERVGQTVTVSVTYEGKTYTESYFDFDLFATDTEFMYVGMFANRGTIVEFSNVEFTIIGESQGA